MARPKKDSIERVIFSTRLDPEIFWELKQKALDERRSIYEVLEDALNSYLNSERSADKGKGRR